MIDTTSKTHPEAWYIKGLLENDRSIIKKIYDEYFSSISKTVCNNSGTESEAWDIFQEALIIIYTKAQKSEFQLTSKFGTFLHSICWHLWLKVLRKKRTGVVITDEIKEYMHMTDENDLLAQENVIGREKLFRKKFDQLGEACRKLLKLYFAKVPMSEISKKMGYSESFSTQKAFRCRKKLIESIKSDEMYQELMD